MDPVLSLSDCVAGIQILACIGIMLDSAEVLYVRDEYKPGGIYDWDLVRGFWPWAASRRLSRPLSAISRYPNYLVIVGMQLLAALLLLSQWLPALALPLVVVILTTRVLFLFRHQYGGEGADQVQVIVFTGLAAYYVAPDAVGQHAGIWFIGLQAIVAYMAAGLAKLRSPAWRDGRALMGVMRSTVFGNQLAAQILDHLPQLSRALGWSTILFECAFPLLAFVGPLPCLVFVAAGLVFHAANALTIGLNRFLWSFGATYPAVLLISIDLNQAGILRGLGTDWLPARAWPMAHITQTWVGIAVVVVGLGMLLAHAWWMGQLVRQHSQLAGRLEQLDAALSMRGCG